MVFGLNSIEVIAVLFSILGLVKIIFVLFNKQAWFNNVSKPVYGGGKVSAFIFIVLAAIVFYYISMQMSLAEILAAATFVMLLVGAGFSLFGNELLEFGRKAANKKLTVWTIIYLLIWIVLSVALLVSVF